MAAPNPPDQAFVQYCNGLRPGSCDDWATKLLDACEKFWAVLGEGNVASRAQMEAFVSMLLHERSFRLACQVIPELNLGRIEDSAGPFKTEISNRLQPMRDHNPFGASRPLRSVFADERYAEERERLTDAEIYRAELLLYTSASLNPQEKEEVRRWLRARPRIDDTPRMLADRTRSLLGSDSAQDDMPTSVPGHG